MSIKRYSWPKDPKAWGITDLSREYYWGGYQKALSTAVRLALLLYICIPYYKFDWMRHQLCSVKAFTPQSSKLSAYCFLDRLPLSRENFLTKKMLLVDYTIGLSILKTQTKCLLCSTKFEGYYSKGLVSSDFSFRLLRSLK